MWFRLKLSTVRFLNTDKKITFLVIIYIILLAEDESLLLIQYAIKYFMDYF